MDPSGEAQSAKDLRDTARRNSASKHGSHEHTRLYGAPYDTMIIYSEYDTLCKSLSRTIVNLVIQ